MKKAEVLLGRATPLVMARVLSAGVTFVIPLLLARRLSLEEFGTYKQLLLVAQTLYYVLPFGLAQSLYYFLPRGLHGRAFLVQTLGVLTAVGLFALMLLGFGSHFLSQAFSNEGLWAHRWFLGLYVFGVIASSPLEVALTAEGKTRVAAMTYLASDGVRTVAMVAPVLMGKGLWGVMVGLAAVSLARVAVTWGWAFFKTGEAFVKGLLRKQWAYTLPFGASVALSVPQVYAHQFAVSSVTSPEAFALYSVACFQLPLTHLLYTPVSEVLMVRVGELQRLGQAHEIPATFQRAVYRLCLAFIPLAFFSWVAAPEMLAALFGKRFLAAVPLYRVGLWSMVLASFPVDGLLRALGHTRHIFRVALVKLCLTLPLLWWAVSHFGMAGAMWVALLLDVVAVALLLWVVPKALGGQPWARLVPFQHMGKVSLAAAGALLSVWAVHQGLDGHLAVFSMEWLRRGLPLLVTAASFAFGYLGMLRILGMGDTTFLDKNRP